MGKSIESKMLMCLVNLSQTELSLKVKKLSNTEICSNVPLDCKAIIIETCFENFDVQIITNFCGYTKAYYRTQNYELCDYFIHSYHGFEPIVEIDKIEKYFESCIPSINICVLILSINRIISTIYKSNTIDNFYGLLTHCVKKIGCHYYGKEMCTFGVLSGKKSSMNNYCQNFYVQIYKVFHDWIISFHCSLFHIEPLRNLILFFIGDNYD